MAPGPVYVGKPSMDAICRFMAEESNLAEMRSDIRVRVQAALFLAYTRGCFIMNSSTVAVSLAELEEPAEGHSSCYHLHSFEGNMSS